MKFKILILIMLFFTLSIFSQSKKTVHFQTKSIEIEPNIDTFSWNQFPKSAIYDNGYYGYIQFENTPTQQIQNEFKQEGLQLLEYIPNQTYLFYFPTKISPLFLKNKGVRAIFSVENDTKIALNLQERPFGEWAIDGNNVLIKLEYHKNIPTSIIKSELNKQNITILKENEFFPIITVSIPVTKIETIASLVFVKWLEQIDPPSVHDDTRGRSLHRVNAIDTDYASGRHYTGDGIGVMVRDDGIVGSHIDFEGRIDNSWASGTGQNHGDGVAGIMTGAGNLDPYMKGMASGASLFVVNYIADYLDTATNTLINNGSVQITNSSYSNGCNDGYTTTTRTVDLQTNNNLNLLHVFSAGNSNNNNCGYGAGDQWGNITGGHKQGKNVIATANVFYDGGLVDSSSRGPAHDGRIKPDIAANGQNQLSTNENNIYASFGGTSGAAPNIVGVAATLYEAYQLNNTGALPESALIKAVMLNTANDLGNVGPDFKYGWGHVNALRAVMTVEDNRFLSSTISQGGANNHTINVPVGTKEVRFMLYWNDPAAAASSSTALVNDLDLVVTDPSNTILLPWVLDHTPNTSTLNLPATNGVDHLNNVEQVLINNPPAGDYNIDVSGFNIPVGPQNYFIVYEIISDAIILTYPLGGESFKPTETEVIHWDSNLDTNNVLIEYTNDNGGSWNTIANVPNSDRLYEWSVPPSISGLCKIRLTKDASTDESHEVFSIAEEVINVNLVQVCPYQITVSCNPVADAVSYDLYLLGDKYMEIIGSSATNSIVAPITNPNDNFWFAIKAVGADGWITKRSNAVFYTGGLFNCSLNNDLELSTVLSPNDGAFCDGDTNVVSVVITNTGIDDQSNFTVSYQLNTEPVVEETITSTLTSGSNIAHDFSQTLNLLSNTSYTLRIWVTLVGDENTTNDEHILNLFVISNETPFLEDVELHASTTIADIQNCWSSIPNNTDTAYRWNVSSIGVTPSDDTGPTSANSGSHYFYTEASTPAQQGDVAELYSPMIDLSTLTVPQLSFYYHMYGQTMGSLHIDIFNNGIWSNDEVVIAGQQQTSGNDNWLEQTLVLTDFTGEIQIRFRGVRGSDFSGDIALDDIQVIEAPSCPKPNSLTATNISSENIALSWNAGNTENNWQIEYGLSGFTQGSGTLIQTGTETYDITGLNSNSAYDVYLRANCGASPGDDDSLWLGPIPFTTLIDFCNGDHFYDSGGINGNHQNDENIITTIAPIIGFNRVTVQFNSFSLEATYDFLTIFDGPDVNSPQLGVFSGSNNPGSFTSTHTSGALTFWFTSDVSVTNFGWDATVICEDTTVSVNNLSIYDFNYYPNPIENTLNLSANQLFNSVKVYSVLGQEVISIKPKNSTDLQINLSTLSSGIYLIKAKIEDKTSNFKIIKK